ncbi:unnamed protein product [Somion occarium]|uniref:Uncharacterized protein n=1 Tax=Somion occarium TaxID=3059160 RepID=A0ABP1EB07_9APHY
MPTAAFKDSISAPNSSAVTPRKRTMSFSSPQPLKSARTPLRRTGSFLSLADMQAAHIHEFKQAGSSTSYKAQAENSSSVPYTRTLRHYKEQRDRRKAIARTSGETPPVFTVTPIHTPVAVKASFQRSTSPLTPQPNVLPPRTHYPRSKPEPDLYRVAITTRMRSSPQGQKILHMGPRLALSIHTATLELERIVAAQRDCDNDISMSSGGEPLLTTSWVVIPPEDWEMVDGSF